MNLTKSQLLQKIDQISRVRNLWEWDNYVNQQVGIVQKNISGLKNFGNLAPSGTLVREGCDRLANELQTKLDAAIKQHKMNP